MTGLPIISTIHIPHSNVSEIQCALGSDKCCHPRQMYRNVLDRDVYDRYDLSLPFGFVLNRPFGRVCPRHKTSVTQFGDIPSILYRRNTAFHQALVVLLPTPRYIVPNVGAFVNIFYQPLNIRKKVILTTPCMMVCGWATAPGRHLYHFRQ